MVWRTGLGVGGVLRVRGYRPVKVAFSTLGSRVIKKKKVEGWGRTARKGVADANQSPAAPGLGVRAENEPPD